jgi:integrase
MPSITKRFVDAAASGRHYDDKLPGFGLYVGASGAKSYFFEYRPGRGRGIQKRRISIGRHGAPWTPEKARDKALGYLVGLREGRDPLDERKVAERGLDAARLVNAVVDEWLKRDQAGNRSRNEVERVMRREVLPIWGARSIEDIRKRDIIALIDGIADRGAPIMANRTLAHVKRLFRWAAARDIIEADRAAHVEKPAPETKRDRVLGDDEIAMIWDAASTMGFPFGPAVRLLVLTAARREEIFGLSWSEVDQGSAAIRLPAERAKTKEGRMIPLSPVALGLLDELPRFVGGDYVFGQGGQAPFANVGHAKARLDGMIAEARDEPMPAWRLHDIRRTVATGLQRLGTRLEVIEAVLGHVSGSRAGIVGIYQRHRFEDEARGALVAWGERVKKLVGADPGAAVVPFGIRRLTCS